MMRAILPFVLLLGLLPSPPPFAVAVVQTASGRATDPVITWSAMGASNHVLVAMIVNNNSSTPTITGVTTTVTTLIGPSDIGSLRGYVWCFPGDGSDTSFTVDGPGGVSESVAAVEISGGSCDPDGAFANAAADAASPYNLTTPITTSQSGSFIIGIAHSTSPSDYSASGSTTSIPADGTDIGGISLGGYVIAGAAGSYDLPFTSAAGETTSLLAAAVKAAGGSSAPKRFLTLGIGGK